MRETGRAMFAAAPAFRIVRGIPIIAPDEASF
jgi:hypothetical protein